MSWWCDFKKDNTTAEQVTSSNSYIEGICSYNKINIVERPSDTDQFGNYIPGSKFKAANVSTFILHMKCLYFLR